jgi:uracil-DNA glycosylase
MPADSIEKFVKLLKHSPRGAVFNPWWQVDKRNDIGPNAPAIRRRQLRAYLGERCGKTELAIIGEALGYRGGHFSGIPMTSERMLLGGMAEIEPHRIFSSVPPRRTSNPKTSPHGFSEPTATVVWRTLLGLGLRPEDFVLWNAFPWHSFDPRRGLLSNRMPTKAECAAGRAVLEAFLELLSCQRIVALGKIAATELNELNVQFRCVRHPASGGAKLFRRQIARLVAQVDYKR